MFVAFGGACRKGGLSRSADEIEETVDSLVNTDLDRVKYSWAGLVTSEKKMVIVEIELYYKVR